MHWQRPHQKASADVLPATTISYLYVMKGLSMLLYFLAHHGAWSFAALLLLGIALSVWRKTITYVIIAFFLAMLNIFTGQFLNAWFLAHNGLKGTALITFSRQTNSTLNDQYIWEYDVLIQTAEGKDIITEFSTTTTSLYPIRNEIQIPPEGERFVVKYIRGFEKNIVVMVDESPYGKRRIVYENMEATQKAERQYSASPGNNTFKEAYRNALRDFIANPENAFDTLSLQRSKDALRTLE